MALPARPFDPLYDTTYTVSGARDHYRQQTAAGGFMLDRAPDYGNMFSELPHHPSTTFRLKNTDKVPAFIDRTFQPEHRNPMDLTALSKPEVVAGQERYKFFKRPMLAAGAAFTYKQAPVIPPPSIPPPPPEPKSKTIGTQSDYRENEAQTMPWDPDVKLPDVISVKQQYLSKKYHCEGPELLQLKDMKFGDGLPPGMQEIKRIEKMRAKRAFEATLPPLNDLEQLPLRQKMIEEWEAKEWEEREQEILGVQEERLQLIDQALQAREEEFEQKAVDRLEARKTAMLETKAPAFGEVQANRIKTMRQLVESRKYVEKHRKLIKPSIVERYANFGSSTYAPVQRDGRFPESKPQGKVIETEGFQPMTLQGINELQAFLPPKLLQPKVVHPAAKAGKLDYNQRKEVAIHKDLKAINALLDTARHTKGLGFGDCWPAPLKESEAALVPTTAASLNATGLNKHSTGKAGSHKKMMVRAVDRPDSPELPPPASMSGNAAREAAAVLIQRLLRGRAAQNLMYEGKMRRQHLIEELQLQGSPQASTTRPEDRHPTLARLDAIMGNMITSMAVALSTESDPGQQQRLCDQALAAAKAAANHGLHGVSLEGLPPSRAVTPLQAVKVERLPTPVMDVQQLQETASHALPPAAAAAAAAEARLLQHQKQQQKQSRSVSASSRVSTPQQAVNALVDELVAGLENSSYSSRVASPEDSIDQFDPTQMSPALPAAESSQPAASFEGKHDAPAQPTEAVTELAPVPESQVEPAQGDATTDQPQDVQQAEAHSTRAIEETEEQATAAACAIEPSCASPTKDEGVVDQAEQSHGDDSPDAVVVASSDDSATIEGVVDKEQEQEPVTSEQPAAADQHQDALPEPAAELQVPTSTDAENTSTDTEAIQQEEFPVHGADQSAPDGAVDGQQTEVTDQPAATHDETASEPASIEEAAVSSHDHGAPDQIESQTDDGHATSGDAQAIEETSGSDTADKEEVQQPDSVMEAVAGDQQDEAAIADQTSGGDDAAVPEAEQEEPEVVTDAVQEAEEVLPETSLAPMMHQTRRSESEDGLHARQGSSGAARQQEDDEEVTFNAGFNGADRSEAALLAEATLGVAAGEADPVEDGYQQGGDGDE